MAEGSQGVIVRKARIDEADKIRELVNYYADKRRMLSRPLSEIYENIRDYFVAEVDGAVVGTAALHVFWEDLAEVRALAVTEELCGTGLGRMLVEACCREARGLGIERVFALTFIPAFFRKLGFSDEKKESLPHKIWTDCIRCPLFPDCAEEAVVISL